MHSLRTSSMIVAFFLSAACGDDSAAPARESGMAGASGTPTALRDAGADDRADAAAEDAQAPRQGDGAEPAQPREDAAVRPPDDAGTERPGDDGGFTQPDAATDAGAVPMGSEGCVSGEGLTQGENSFMRDGRTRRYVLHLPNGYSRSRAWPVVFALHGNGGSLDYWNQDSGDRNIRGAVEDDAILVLAEAIGGNWRDYDMPAESWPARIEAELSYFDAIVERVKSELCVNESAIFALGFSGGGSFSGVLGCRRDYIRAIAAGGSAVYFDEADCINAPASWITIGTEELNSGREAFRDYFRQAAMCEATSSATDPEPCVAYDDCASEAPVHYCQHPGGHVWPAFGTQAAWGFFQRFID